MSRLMSVAYTEQAVVDRIKHVTRRKGWSMLSPGDRVTLCRKVQGRRRASGYVEPLVRLAEVEILGVRRERLDLMITDPVYGAAEVAAEGFPGMEPVEFIHRFFTHAQGIPAEAVITRVEWRYLDACDECGHVFNGSPITLRGGVARCYVCEHEATCDDPACAWCVGSNADHHTEGGHA